MESILKMMLRLSHLTKNSISGQQLIIGDSSGCLHIYDVNESLYNVRPGEWEDFERFNSSNLNF